MVLTYSRYDLITSILRDRQHWLMAPRRTDFKRCFMGFNALHGLALGYTSIHSHSLVNPAASESAFCKSQLFGSGAPVKDYQVQRAFVWN